MKKSVARKWPFDVLGIPRVKRHWSIYVDWHKYTNVVKSCAKPHGVWKGFKLIGSRNALIFESPELWVSRKQIFHCVLICLDFRQGFLQASWFLKGFRPKCLDFQTGFRSKCLDFKQMFGQRWSKCLDFKRISGQSVLMFKRFFGQSVLIFKRGFGQSVLISNGFSVKVSWFQTKFSVNVRSFQR